VLDGVERIFMRLSCDCQKGHAVSTTPVSGGSAHATDSDSGRAAICRRNNRNP
jgi:hypothetical protein